MRSSGSERRASPVTEVVLVLTTVPSNDGERIARTLVDERLAACVNILPAMLSVYRWQGAVEQAEERQLVAKTAIDRVETLTKRLIALHPYDLPEILVLPATGGSDRYLTWVNAETRADL